MATERSLERCGVERFDLLLLHNPDRIGYSSAAVWEGMEAVREAGLTRLLGVAPGPANGFTLDLIDCLERFSRADRLGDDHPRPARAVAGRAGARGGRRPRREPDHARRRLRRPVPRRRAARPRVRRVRPPQVPPRRLGGGRPREARADAPVRRASRAEHAAARVRVEPRAAGGALRRADADPGERRTPLGRSRTSAPSWRPLPTRCAVEPPRRCGRSVRSARTPAAWR